MRDLIGIVKDKASLSKLALLTNPTTLSLHLAVLRATSHSPSTPPTHHHLSTLLSLGDSSRATASTLITSLLTRLHRTTDSHVALKSLLTIHHILHRGPFILKDQLSVFSAAPRRNNFKLRHPTTAWVRWYAAYIETILHTSKHTATFLMSSFLEKQKQQDSISSFRNCDLIRDFESLVRVIQEICKVPDNLQPENDKLLNSIMELVTNDYLSAVNEILVRLVEFKERVDVLSFTECVELGTELDRLRSCKQKLMQLFCNNRKASVERLWEMIDELSDGIGMVKFGKVGSKERWSESARFGDRVVRPTDSLKFSSGRFRLRLDLK